MRDFNSSFELRFELILFVSHYKTNISFFFFFNEYRGSNYARSFSPFRGVLLHSRLCRLSSTSLGILIHMVRLIWGASPSVWSTIRKKNAKKKEKKNLLRATFCVSLRFPPREKQSRMVFTLPC